MGQRLSSAVSRKGKKVVDKIGKKGLLDAVKSGILSRDAYGDVGCQSFLTDDYDGVHIIVTGDSEEAIEQLICLFTQEAPVVAVDRKHVPIHQDGRLIEVVVRQVRREGRSFVLYQLPAYCHPTYIFSRLLHKYRFLPIIWWVVCESLHHALSYIVKKNNKRVLYDYDLPIVLLNCIISAEKKCQHIKVVGCIRLGDLAIIDIGARFLEIQNVASLCKPLEEYLFKVSKHESMSSEKWDGDKGGQLFTIAVQAQGLSQLLQQSKNLMIEDGLNCAWGSWSLPSIYRRLHLSTKLVDMVVENSSLSYYAALKLPLIWHFPFQNNMNSDYPLPYSDDDNYVNKIMIWVGYFVGLIIWMKWSHITESLKAYTNTNVQRPWMETSKISEKHPIHVDEGDIVKECQNFGRSSFGTKVNEFLQGLKTMQKSVTSDEIEKFYHGLLLDGDLDCNNDVKIFQNLSPHDDLHKELENTFKDMAFISINHVVPKANIDTVIARKISTGRDDLELVFHTGKAMSSCVGVGLDHSIVEVGNEVLIKQKKQILWEETLGLVANREEEYVIVHVRNDFACSCIRTFTQETSTSENPYGVSLGAVTSYYEMQSTPNCPHGHAPLLHLLSKFVLDVLKGKQSLHKVSKYGEKPLMLFDFEKLREAVREVGEELGAGRFAQSTAKDLISGVVVVSGDAGGSSVNSEFGGVGTSKGTSSNDGNEDQDGMNNGSENNGDDDGDGNGNPDNEGRLQDKSNDKEHEVTIYLDPAGTFEPENPPSNIKDETIVPTIIVKFLLEGKRRSITITAWTKFSQNAKPEGEPERFVWYHDDIFLDLEALQMDTNGTPQASDETPQVRKGTPHRAARLEGPGEILNPTTAGREYTSKNNASKSKAATQSTKIAGQAQALGVAKLGTEDSESFNNQESASQGCDVKSSGPPQVCDGFTARSQSDGHALRYRLKFPFTFYHLENPQGVDRLVEETGLFSTIEPQIRGKWIPHAEDRLKNAHYVFEASRAWKKLEPAVERFKQRYKIILFVNHDFSHMRVPVDGKQMAWVGQIWP